MDQATSSFLHTMKHAGLNCQEQIIADGKLHRFKNEGDSRPNSWYVYFDDKIPTGTFGCWKRAIKQKWYFSDDNELYPKNPFLIANDFSKAKKTMPQ